MYPAENSRTGRSPGFHAACLEEEWEAMTKQRRKTNNDPNPYTSAYFVHELCAWDEPCRPTLVPITGNKTQFPGNRAA